MTALATEARVTLTWPVQAWPNPNRDRRKHWTRERREGREIRNAAHVIARSQRVTVASPVAVSIVWTFPDGRDRDIENWSSKALLDGIVDAGLIPDDNARKLARIEKSIDRTTRTPRGYLRATVTIRTIEKSEPCES